MKKELDDIEKKIAELKKRKQEILNEEKNRKEERGKREKEVQDAYETFIKLLKAFEEDYNINISISYDARKDSPVRFKAW